MKYYKYQFDGDSEPQFICRVDWSRMISEVWSSGLEEWAHDEDPLWATQGFQSDDILYIRISKKEAEEYIKEKKNELAK